MLKRLLKLLISLAVRGWDILRATRDPFCIVLYYHGVDAAQRQRFARQMDELLRLARPVKVTFDDGFMSVIENACPELESRNIPATLFIPTGSLGGKPTWMNGSDEIVLSTAQLTALKDRPLIDIGSHSVTHQNMTRLDAASAELELRKSRADLEHILGRRVTLFSFPYGRYDGRLLELAKAAGYEHVFSIEPRPVSSDDEILAGRVAVSPDDWPLEFKLKALGAYRWLAPHRQPQMTSEEWDRLTGDFADATLYQSWAYGAVHWCEKQLQHFVVREAGKVIGLAQVRVIRFPLGLGGIAYVTRGPLWRRKDLPDDASRLKRVLDALREEYCVRRRYYLRVIPQVFASEMDPQIKGFQRRESSYRTLLIDLSVGVEQLRAGLRASWRQCLNKADAKGFEIVEGSDARLFDEVLAMQKQMHRRKQYAEFVNAAEFRRMQEMLPPGRKLQMLVCRKNGQPVAGVVWAAFGETGLPLFGGTGDQALGDDASYALHWRLLLAMKERGLRYCDLGGINPDRNPGSYTFKTGMAKKTGKDVRLVGDFDACQNPISRAVFHAIMGTRERYRRLRIRLEQRGQTKPERMRAASRFDISVVIVNWNTRKCLAACLESIERTAAGLAHEIIVVDNHSLDGSQQMVRERFPGVRLIENEDNLGFSRANNRGLEHATGRYVCFVNSDIVVHEGCLQALREFMERSPRVGLAGPRLLNADGSVQPYSRRFPTFARHLGRALFVNASLADPAGRGDVAADVEVLAGAFWMARREAIGQVGNLDERFFMYGEDMDWCRRFWKAGWRVTSCPAARAVHHGSASSAADSVRCNIELQRAKLQLWEKYHGRTTALAYLVVSAAHDAVRSFVSRNARQHRDSLRWHLNAIGARLGCGREDLALSSVRPLPAKSAQDPIRFGFAGDLFLGGEWISYAARHGLDILKPFERVRGALSELDILFVNLEGPLFASPETALMKSVLLANHPDVVRLLQMPAACVCNLANNHILDYGPAPLERTQQRLQDAGIEYVGAGSNAAAANRGVIVDCRGRRIGCLGLTTDEPEVGSILARNGQAGCASLKDEAAAFDRVRELKANVDAVVVMLHWGHEFHEYPSVAQVRFARALVDAGADFVVGQHAHFVQGFEKYRQGTIFYSLGHFFVAPFRMTDGRTRYLKPPAKEFALAVCDVTRGSEVSVEMVGGRWGHDCVLRPHPRAKQGEFTSRLRRLSEPLQSTGYEVFWLEYSQKRRRQLKRERISDGLGALKERLMNRELCR